MNMQNAQRLFERAAIDTIRLGEIEKMLDLDLNGLSQMEEKGER